MKLISFNSIRSRLTFWFLIIGILPLMVGILISFQQEKKIIRKITISKLVSIRDLKVQQLNQWTDERTSNIKSIANDMEIRQLEKVLDDINFDQKDIDKNSKAKYLLNNYLNLYKDFTELFIVNAKNGNILVSSDPNKVGLNKSFSTSFKHPLVKGEPYISELIRSKESNQAEMTFSAPIYGASHNQHIIGVIIGRIDLDNSLYKLLQNRVGLGETGETLIVNKEGIALNDLRWYDNAPLNLKISAQPATRGANGETGITTTADYRGVEVLAAYTYISDHQWGFVTKQDMNELNEPIRQTLKKLTILLAVSLVLVLIIMFWVISRTTNPILELNTVAQKIRNGNYTIRSVIRGRDEITSLSVSINDMSEAIESRISFQGKLREISELLAGIDSIDDFGTRMLLHLMNVTGSDLVVLYTFNSELDIFEPTASIGAERDLLPSFNASNPEGELGVAWSKKSLVFTDDIPEETIFKFRTTSGSAIPREMVTIPLLNENNIVAFLSFASIRKIDIQNRELLSQSWKIINTAYAKLLTVEKNRKMTVQIRESNHQLESQAEELQAQTEELQSQAEELQNYSEELQEQNIELEMQKSQVLEANKLKTEFLSNMSHELRTPLNSINALSGVLIQQTSHKLSEEESNYLEIVERNGKRLLTLINDILDLSKIEAGKMDIITQKLTVETILDQLKENFQPLALQKNLSINIKIPENIPVIETDELRIHQVLTNIIGNAIKFTESGSVDIEAKFDSDKIHILVRDTGIGIPKNKLPYIFDEFRQGDGTSSRKYEGTGLGLSIADKLIKILGGNIKVDSKVGEGSVFTISVPLVFSSELPNSNSLNYDLRWTKTQSIKNRRSLNPSDIRSGKRILIVEDNPDAISQLKSLLEDEGYIVDIARGGKEALDYIKEFIPDGILLDLMMPDIDGFAVLNMIRDTEKTKDIPVLVLTAKDLTSKEIKRLKSNNIQQLILKGDIDNDSLRYKLNDLMSEKATTEETEFQNPDISNRKHQAGNTSPKKRKQKVLVIENNHDHMIAIRAMLGDEYLLCEADDGNTGVSAAIQESPEIILLDLTHPGLKAGEIINILKNKEETRHIPIIVVTAKAMIGDKQEIMKFGCDGYITKPINLEELKQEMDRLLS